MPPSSLSIVPLARHREHLALLATWFEQEWPAWYGSGGRGNAGADLEAFASSESTLPVGLVVLEHGVPIGIGALKAESLPTHRHLHPWVGAGYVLPARRRMGIGAKLLAALANQAHNLGYRSLYCATSTAIELLRRSGWVEVERTEHEGKSLVIFRRNAV
jgi:GNAT superfamily N-acetyltransferase